MDVEDRVAERTSYHGVSLPPNLVVEKQRGGIRVVPRAFRYDKKAGKSSARVRGHCLWHLPYQPPYEC